MAIILPANTLSAGAYEVANSCRFNYGDSPLMVKAIGTPTSTKICTISIWFKRADIGREQHFFGQKKDGNERSSIGFDDSTEGELHITQEDSGSVGYQFRTNRKFRDPSAWSHLVLAIETSLIFLAAAALGDNFCFNFIGELLILLIIT